MRNSSLVEGSRAENVTGLKFTAEAADPPALRGGMVGERCQGVEAAPRGAVERWEVRMSA